MGAKIPDSKGKAAPQARSPSPLASVQNLAIETDPGAGLDQKLQPGDHLELQQ